MPSIGQVMMRLKALITRAEITEVSDTEAYPFVKAAWLGARESADQEYLQPYGSFFVPPTGAEGLRLGVFGSSSNAVVICAQSRDASPGGAGASPGEGGLHYLGAWKVWLDSDGTVHLGDQDPGDAVPVDSALQTELARLKSELDNFKAVFDAHIHVTTATIGASATPGVLSPPATPFTAPASPGTTASSKVLIPGDT